MLNEIEQILIEHKDFLILIFTLALVFSGLATALVTYLNVRELEKQHSLQKRIFLQSTLITLTKIKYDLEKSLYSEENKRDLIADNLEFIRKEIYDINKEMDKK